MSQQQLDRIEAQLLLVTQRINELHIRFMEMADLIEALDERRRNQLLRAHVPFRFRADHTQTLNSGASPPENGINFFHRE
jgi:hypothetical protein